MVSRVAHLLVFQGAWILFWLRVLGRQPGSAHGDDRHAHRFLHALQQRRSRGHLQGKQASSSQPVPLCILIFLKTHAAGWQDLLQRSIPEWLVFDGISF